MKTSQKRKRNDFILLERWLVVLFCMLFVIVMANHSFLQYLLAGFGKIDTKHLQVYYFDVGQASATLIVLPNDDTVVIDTGDVETEDSFVDDVKIVLNRNKISKITYLFLTHPDADHIGGAVKLFKSFDVLNVYRPKMLSTSTSENSDNNYSISTSTLYKNVMDYAYAEPNCKVKFVEDCVINTLNFSLKVYAPKDDVYSQTNAYSPFILLTYKQKSFLFTGDVTAKRESEFVDDFADNPLSVDFLAVAHHGSKYSTTEAFLSVTNPKCAIISAGDDTHPAQEVIKRLKNNGVSDIFCTKSDGTIAIGVDTDGDVLINLESGKVDLALLTVLVTIAFFAILHFAQVKHSASYKSYKMTNKFSYTT